MGGGVTIYIYILVFVLVQSFQLALPRHTHSPVDKDIMLQGQNIVSFTCIPANCALNLW